MEHLEQYHSHNGIKLTDIKQQLVKKLMQQMDLPADLLQTKYSEKYATTVSAAPTNDKRNASRKCKTERVEMKNTLDMSVKAKPLRPSIGVTGSSNVKYSPASVVNTARQRNKTVTGVVKPRKQSGKLTSGLTITGRPKSASGMLTSALICH